MTWVSLNLWADEERRIHRCLVEALGQLIVKRAIGIFDEEKLITGRLRPLLKATCKRNHLDWTLHPEASSFEMVDDPDPFAHPDIRFSRLDMEHTQHDYDVECKLIRTNRPSTDTDYCYNYVRKGVLKFQSGKYAQSLPPMGTMVGYLQEGEFIALLNLVNNKSKYQGLKELRLTGAVAPNGVTCLTQPIERNSHHFLLYHLWADFR